MMIRKRVCIVILSSWWLHMASAFIWWSATSIFVVTCWSPSWHKSASRRQPSSRAKMHETSRIASTALFGSIQSINSNNTETKLSKPAWVSGPDIGTKPDYDNINGPLGSFMDNVFLRVFRGKLAEYCGFDSKLPQDDYVGLIELASAMNSRYSDRTQVQQIAQATLRSLFPSWMPPQFSILFSKPFPEFSSRLNAWATMVGGTWLMGECEVNDVVSGDGTILKDQGLLVKRCRFLEESGCASICVNSCKIPTQNFFMEDMGLPLTMTPDYETHECQFAFGVAPDAQNEFDAKNTPCLSRCPTAGSMRKWHNGDDKVSEKSSAGDGDGMCSYMDNNE